MEALDFATVGRYALQFLWSDFHTTGIYPYVTLRRLCQCDLCRNEKAKASSQGSP
ncbi:MAG: DUF971 domain-containing protein [Chloroflexi bacterium]|nr:DUF971 domain-containing protein [Chloroflexota bacterium]